jgi:hypothetical protein
LFTVSRETGLPKEPGPILPPPVKVVINGFAAYPVRLFTVTAMGWYVAPTGTFTVKAVALAAETAALAAPKKTILFAGVALKPAPVMVTVVPTGPETGENAVIAGCACALFNQVIIKKQAKAAGHNIVFKVEAPG